MAICIYCDKELDALEYHESGIALFSFIEHPEKSALGYYGSLDFKNDGVGEYKCPRCKKTLFIDEAAAVSFLMLKAENACEFCRRENGIEQIYDEVAQRDVWICSTCESQIEWMPASSCSDSKTERRWS
jgi:transposase-like protein